MKSTSIAQVQKEIVNKGKMPMIYTTEEIEEVYNNFFKGLCMELIPLKTKETVMKCLDLKCKNKGYKQEEICTYVRVDQEEELVIDIDFVTFFKPETLVEYGIYVPSDDILEDMLLPSPYLDSNEVIDNILKGLSKELGRVIYERDSKKAGLEKFFQFLFDSEDIKLVGIEQENETENYIIIFEFPIE